MAHREVTGRKPLVTADRIKRRRGPPHAATDPVELDHEQGEQSESAKTRADPQPVEPTPHAEPNSQASVKTPPVRGPPVARAAFSIPEFCEAHRISVRAYFKMKAEGWGPSELHVGRRVLISFEAAARWRAEREAAAAADLQLDKAKRGPDSTKTESHKQALT